MIWRSAQRAIALVGLLVLGPLVFVLAVAVKVDSRGPALHRANRLSRGRPYTMLKLRTMRAGAAAGPAITARGDARVTGIGRLLRRTKLDELPQLWNVVRGDMLLVGPRPEDPRYADMDNPLHREVFGATPGITGPTAIEWRDEEARLALSATALAHAAGRSRPAPEDVERAYREQILPLKLASDAEYLRTRSVRGDLAVIGRTIGAVIGLGRGR